MKNQYKSFDSEGVLLYGVYTGKTLDEVYQLDPLYLMRLIFYKKYKWHPQDRVMFEMWMNMLRDENPHII
jgi:hypothetical protein